jgi:hypothetical protein
MPERSMEMDAAVMETTDEYEAAHADLADAGCCFERVLRNLFPPLEPRQARALRRMIQAGDLVPRVVVWRGTGVVVDGRETRRICDELGMEPETDERDFDDLEAVVRWRIENQLLHRNLTPIAASYYRGRHYLSLKKQGRRTDLTSRQTGEMRTDRLLGRLYGVGARTISRDADLCKALDAIAEKQAGDVLDPVFADGFILSPDFRSSVLSGRIRPPRSEIMGMARMRQDEMARAIRDMLEAQKRPRRKPVPPAPKPNDPPEPLAVADGTEGPSKPMEATAPHGPQAGAAPVAGMTQADRCEGVESDAPPLDEEEVPDKEDADAIDGPGLVEINRLWGRLGRATRLAFLTQDEVSKVVAEAGYVRPLRTCG